MMKLPSRVMEDAVNEFSRLPGIGRKTALRLVLHLMKQDEQGVRSFSESLIRLKEDIRYCRQCNNIAENDFCSICQNQSRQQSIICVVESLRDLLAIEQTQQYNGTYHILGGVISPVEGIGPDQLSIEQLINRITTMESPELIMALNPTIEGDTTTFYIASQVSKRLTDVRITSIARGISFGGELEYTDEITLARSLAARLPYQRNMSSH
jgi:recombination protein RecR